MKLELDKKNTLVNLGNSILKKYEVPTFHSSIPEIDKLLSKTKKNVCLILLDGYGKNIIYKNKEDCPFIFDHLYHEFKSIFPPTTVAATNGLLHAKYPSETGFCGWTQYFKKLDKYVTVFPSREAITNELVTPNVHDTYFDNETIIDLINKGKKYKAHVVSAVNFETKDGVDIDGLFEEADNTLDLYDFTYLYSTEPDHTMHGFGTKSPAVSEIISYLDKKVESLVKNHPDTLFMLVADHGMTDTTNLYLEDYPDFVNTLEDKLVFIEGRFAAFKVKNEKEFINQYNKHFKDYFLLYSKEEMLNLGLLGPKENAIEQFKDTLGDYFLLAKDRYTLANTKSFVLIGNHAGVTSDELEICLAAFNN